MKFRSETQTAVRALLDLCLHSAPQQPTSLSEIARRQGLSASFLEQLFRRLKSAGIVSPWRGVKGGYTLGRTADKISLFEIFEALGDPMTRKSKLGTGAEVAEALIVRQVFEEASGAFHGKLSMLTLADLKRRSPRQSAAMGL